MNFKFAEKINPWLEKFDFEKALDIAETKLKKIDASDFHAILGKSLINQADSLAIWIEEFYRIASKKIIIKAFYFEMNEFDINTTTWYIDGFAFSKDGGLNLDDMEWLCYSATDTDIEMENDFIIKGLEELQNAFKNIECDTKMLQNAKDWSEQIIIARFMELMRTSHLIAKEKGLNWANIPIYFTEHSYDFILKSENLIL